MTDEPRFVAKVVKNLPVDNSQKGQLDNFLHSNKVFSKVKDVAPTIPTIDLSVNTNEFKNSIQKVMNEEPLTNHFSLFSSRRRSEKIRLERERVNDLLSIIDRAIETNRNIIRYNVDVFITQQMLEKLALQHAVGLEQYARDVLRGEELKQRLHEDGLDEVDDKAQKRKAELKALEIANLKAQAEVNQMEAKTKQDKIKADLMQKAVDNIDKLPPSLQTYIFRAVFNPADKQEDDILLQDEVREYLKTEREAQAEVKKQEARKMKIQGDLDEWTKNETIKQQKK